MLCYSNGTDNDKSLNYAVKNKEYQALKKQAINDSLVFREAVTVAVSSERRVPTPDDVRLMQV